MTFLLLLFLSSYLKTLYLLGDSKGPFANLGKNLKLPQTATLSVQAPEPVPYMDGHFQWFPSFDMLTGDCKYIFVRRKKK